MTNEEDCSALALGNVFHLTYRFLLELRIAHRKHFIHHQYLRLQERCHRKSQSDRHTRAIALNRGVDIPFAAAEVNDLIELGLDLCAAHAQDSSVHEDILPTGHLAMEAGADFQQGADTAVGTDSTSGGACDAGEELEKCRLTGTVLADDADDVALLDLEVDVAEGPDVFGGAFGGTIVGLADLEIRVLLAEDVGDPEATDVVTQRLSTHQSEAILFTYMLKLYSYVISHFENYINYTAYDCQGI